MRNAKSSAKSVNVRPTKPSCFISYSTREPHVALLIEAADAVFSASYDIRRTPSALTSGASQLSEIVKVIEECSFAIVSLDGLRPNVVFEYGVLHGLQRPVILLKEAAAQVDVQSFFKDSASLGVTPMYVDLDTQFSDVKDVNYVKWNRYSFAETVEILHSEYEKKKALISPFIEIPRPKLW